MRYLILLAICIFTFTSCDSDNGSGEPQNNTDDMEEMDDDASADNTFNVTNNGASSYSFNGTEFTNADNPVLTFKRGETYAINVDAPGHPFFIKTIQGTGEGNAYNEGVTNNGTVNGTITFTVSQDAPDTLFYNCQFHTPMTNRIRIID